MAKQNSDTLSIDRAVAEALRANPRIRAARLRAEAAAERVGPAGSLPDPGLAVGLMNRSIHGFNTNPQMATNSVQLSQRFPWPGRLDAEQGRVGSLAQAEASAAEEVAATVAGRVRVLYYRIAYLDRAVGIMGETVGLLRDLSDLASTRYSVGSAPQQDVLTAQVTASRMDAEIEVMAQLRTAAVARFNALLGRLPDEPVGVVDLPAIGLDVESLDDLMAAAASARPALHAARVRIEAAGWARGVADRGHLPDLNVTLGYGQRPQYDDLVSVMVGVSLPLRRGSLQEPRRREAAALEAAAVAAEVDLYNETYASLAELRAQLVRTANLSELYLASVIPQSQAAVESGLSAYRVGALEFSAVLQSQLKLNQYRIELVLMTAEHNEALAGISQLTGTSIGASR